MAKRRKGSKRRRAVGHVPLRADRLASLRRSVERDDATYLVQRLPSATKTYRCPGCQQLIGIGSPHVVAWVEEGPLGLTQGVEGRRHWHPACWERGF